MTTVALVPTAVAVPAGEPSTWTHTCGEVVTPVEGQPGKYFCVKCLTVGEPQEWAE